MANQDAVARVRDLSAWFGSETVLHEVTAEFRRGEISVILGASGSGKTTILRHLLGLLTPRRGSVELFGEDLSTCDPPRLASVRERLGMLFQAGALVTSLSVAENVAVPIEQHTDLPPAVVDRIVGGKLQLVGLGGVGSARVSELSGGMRKRVALARAMALDPELLLCDEPSAGLDPVTAESLDRLLIELKQSMEMSLIVISHDLISVRRLADRVFFLHDGTILFHGTMEEAQDSDLPELTAYFHAAR